MEFDERDRSGAAGKGLEADGPAAGVEIEHPGALDAFGPNSEEGLAHLARGGAGGQPARCGDAAATQLTAANSQALPTHRKVIPAQFAAPLSRP